MNQISKKVLAIVMTVAMVMAMGVSAYADTPNMPSEGKYGATDQTLTEGINLLKEIVFVNPDGASVYEPNITFNYEVQLVDSTTPAKITDATNNSASVRPGPAGGLSVVESVTFSASNDIVSTQGTGAAVLKPIALTVNLSAFEGVAGIYRYKIHESVNADDFQKASLMRSENYVEDRFIDVYVKNGESGLEVYGFTCFEGSVDSSIGATYEGKNSGFTNHNDLQDVDVYYTYNVSVTKVIKGTLADMLHKFPFTVTVSGQDANAKYQYKLADAEANTDALLGGDAIEQALGNNKTIEIYGLPANATIAVSENNNTADAYALVISNDKAGAVNTFDEAIAAGVDAAMSDAAVAVSNYSAGVVATVAAPEQQYGAIQFQNTLDAVSPTGLVIRFAPYVIMFGLAWLVVFTTKKQNEDASNMNAI